MMRYAGVYSRRPPRLNQPGHQPERNRSRPGSLRSFGHALTETIYYGQGSGAFTATALLSDPLAGLKAFTFPLTVDLGQTYNLDGATQTTLLHSYAFDVASTFSATTALTATDRARNETTQPFSVVYDTLPPLLTVTVPPTVPLRFSVARKYYNEWRKERIMGDNSLVSSFVVVSRRDLLLPGDGDEQQRNGE